MGSLSHQRLLTAVGRSLFFLHHHHQNFSLLPGHSCVISTTNRYISVFFKGLSVTFLTSATVGSLSLSLSLSHFEMSIPRRDPQGVDEKPGVVVGGCVCVVVICFHSIACS